MRKKWYACISFAVFGLYRHSSLVGSSDTLSIIFLLNSLLKLSQSQAYLLKFDSVYGQFQGKVDSLNNNELRVDDQTIRVLQEDKPSEINWKDAGAQYIIESTGFFNKKAECVFTLQPF
jgi:glyceraldehyde-3-phosphate dehydrogenase/erythrose-4-phosphate dehydrogenase